MSFNRVFRASDYQCQSRNNPESEFVNLSRSGIDSQPGGPGRVRQPYLTYRSARLHSLESIPGLMKRLQSRVLVSTPASSAAQRNLREADEVLLNKVL
jgi:hypothetical protein